MFFVFFLLIYGPVLVDLNMGNAGDVVIITALLVIIYGIVFRGVVFNKIIWLFMLPLFLIFIYGGITLAVFDMSSFVDDISIIFKPLRIIITFLGIYVFLVIFYSRYGFTQESGRRLIQWLYWAIVIHSIIMIAEFYFLGFRHWVYSFTNAQYVLAWNQDFRMAGLSGAGGAPLSVFQGMSFILLPFILKYTRNKPLKIIYFLTVFLIVYSLILCGRSGMVEGVIFFPISYILIQETAVGRLKALTLIFILMFSVIVLYGIVYVLVNTLPETDLLRVAFYRSFQTFIDYSQNSQLHDDTISALVGMWKLPDDPLQLIFGRLNALNYDNYSSVQSDIGYIQYLYGYGIIGSIILYSFYWASIRYVWRLKSFNKDLAYLVILTNISILFFQAKESFAFSKMGFSITSLLLISFIILYRKKRLEYLNEMSVGTIKRGANKWQELLKPGNN